MRTHHTCNVHTAYSDFYFRKKKVDLVHISVLALLLIDPWLYISSPFKYHLEPATHNVHVKTFTSKGWSQFFDNVTLSTSAASILNWCFHYSHTFSLSSNLVFINFYITFHVKDRFNYCLIEHFRMYSHSFFSHNLCIVNWCFGLLFSVGFPLAKLVAYKSYMYCFLKLLFYLCTTLKNEIYC